MKIFVEVAPVREFESHSLVEQAFRREDLLEDYSRKSSFVLLKMLSGFDTIRKVPSPPSAHQ